MRETMSRRNAAAITAIATALAVAVVAATTGTMTTVTNIVCLSDPNNNVSSNFDLIYSYKNCWLGLDRPIVAYFSLFHFFFYIAFFFFCFFGFFFFYKIQYPSTIFLISI